MLNQLTKTTRRKFYNKWLYKVSLRIPGAMLIRVYSRTEVEEFIKQAHITSKGIPSNWKSRAWSNRGDIKDLLTILDDYESELWTKRIEREQVDIYTNEKDLYEKLSNHFELIMIHRFEPDPATIDTLEKRDGKTMTVKKLPKDRYQYRVYLLPHNLSGLEDKERFISWLESSKPRVTCTPSIQKWILSNKNNWDRRYILVEDEGTLVLLKMRNPDVVGTVYKFEIV